MYIKEGYVYHIKDEYFTVARDDQLMKNKEGNNYRPTYYCIKDKKNPDILWVVPMSKQYDKFKKIYDTKIKRYKECIGIVLGKFDGSNSVFLIQNMFPILKQHIHHIHTKKGNPVPVHTKIMKIIEANVEKALLLSEKNINVVFPDIIKLRDQMLQILNNNNKQSVSKNAIFPKETSIQAKTNLMIKEGSEILKKSTCDLTTENEDDHEREI